MERKALNQKELLAEVEARREKILEGGGIKAAEKMLRPRGKLTAAERIDILFDLGTFRELGMWAKPLKTGFDIDKADVSRDAMIAGYGKINGRTVYATCYDPTVFGGSQAAMQFEKLGKTMQQAREEGHPYIGIIDSGGRRIQDLFGRWSYRAPTRVSGFDEGALDMVGPPMLSGVVPQISLVLGASVAGTAYSPVMSDFVFFRKGTSYMAVASPQLLKAVTFQDITWDDIGSAELHATTTGTCDVLVESDEEALLKCRELLGYLPSNWQETPPPATTSDKAERSEATLLDVLPADPAAPYDVRDIIRLLVDDSVFFEIQALYAANMVTAFSHLDGRAVGIVANNPLVERGALSANACDKAGRFIRTCDAFNIPVIILVDTPGFPPSLEAEQSQEGLSRHAAKPVFAISEATVPMVNVYLRKCYGAGRLVMGSREMGVDVAYAWPSAEIRQRDLVSLVKEVYAKEIKKAVNPEKAIRDRVIELEAAYKEPFTSGALLGVDDIIDPAATRPVIINALERLSGKKAPDRPWRKHGLIPL